MTKVKYVTINMYVFAATTSLETKKPSQPVKLVCVYSDHSE